jgi:hypothetical protein
MKSRNSIARGEIVERAFDHTFAEALVRMVQTKAEAMIQKAFSKGSPLAQKLEAKTEEGFARFIADGIRWDKKKPGFKKS